MNRLIVLLLLLFGLVSSGHTQTYGKHPFDSKKFHLGFQMGLNWNGYNLKEQIRIYESGVWLDEVTVIPRWGMSFAMISNFNIKDYLAIRIIPGISLEQRDFNFYFEDSYGPVDTVGPIARNIEAAYLNVPVLFQWRTKYWNRSRLYVLTGAQIGINLQSDKKVIDDPNKLKINTQDLSLVIGTGLNLYGDRLKLSPEIRYSFGLTNIYQPENTTHAAAISALFSQVLTLSINFE
ncbi:MAG: PorT family protein [Bacteroidia bacterium]|nr:PorT family protein [Bacteroidia bacterium]